jgi:hypothetical protein
MRIHNHISQKNQKPISSIQPQLSKVLWNHWFLGYNQQKTNSLWRVM